MQLTIARTRAELEAALQALRAGGARVAFVPTMGALHAGHRSLVREAKRHAEHVATSIFVNPLQFGAHEDLARYPRPFEQDVRALQEEGAAVLFAPTPEEMYPAGFGTAIHVEGPSEGLEGAVRPGHFDGVATVVAKLFMLVRPDRAIFGEKDYQQLMVVKKMARDLAMPVEIIAAPTLREADGLAMSSRNVYLSPEERAIAPAMYRVLREAADRLAAGAGVEALVRAEAALREAGFASVDYVALRDAETFAPVEGAARPARLLAAARLGTTRLIDNIAVKAAP